MTAPTLTAARRRALGVLVLGERTGRPVRISNSTGQVGRLTIYWQSARWLKAQGLIEMADQHSYDAALTDAGRQLAAGEGIS